MECCHYERPSPADFGQKSHRNWRKCAPAVVRAKSRQPGARPPWCVCGSSGVEGLKRLAAVQAASRGSRRNVRRSHDFFPSFGRIVLGDSDHSARTAGARPDHLSGRRQIPGRRPTAPIDPACIDAQELDGLLVTSRVQTVLDLAAFVPFAEALVPLDHVLKPDPVRGLPALTKEELLSALPGRYVFAAERRVRAAIESADAASGSAGESYSRGLILAAGFSRPELQYEVRSSTGRVGYSDFYWEESQTVGEFDGIAKYQRAEYLRGRTPGQVVVDEKLREDRIRATGRNVVRWVWADLRKAGELERKLTGADVPRRRRFSSGSAKGPRTHKRSRDT